MEHLYITLGDTHMDVPHGKNKSLQSEHLTQKITLPLHQKWFDIISLVTDRLFLYVHMFVSFTLPLKW